MDVHKILMDTELTCHGDEIKAWYDGYHLANMMSIVHGM